jgi:hypothetical protein
VIKDPTRRPLTLAEVDRFEQLFEEIQGQPLLPWQRLLINMITVVVRDDRT